MFFLLLSPSYLSTLSYIRGHALAASFSSVCRATARACMFACILRYGVCVQVVTKPHDHILVVFLQVHDFFYTEYFSWCLHESTMCGIHLHCMHKQLYGLLRVLHRMTCNYLVGTTTAFSCHLCCDVHILVSILCIYNVTCFPQ
jgi:hypothetical protein